MASNGLVQAWSKLHVRLLKLNYVTVNKKLRVPVTLSTVTARIGTGFCVLGSTMRPPISMATGKPVTGSVCVPATGRTAPVYKFR